MPLTVSQLVVRTGMRYRSLVNCHKGKATSGWADAFNLSAISTNHAGVFGGEYRDRGCSRKRLTARSVDWTRYDI